MAVKKYTSFNTLNTFISKVFETFASKTIVDELESNAETYLLNIDYSLLEFDTSEIV